MDDERKGLPKVTRASTPALIPRGRMFVKRTPRNGCAIFRLYRIWESVLLLVLSVEFLLPTCLLGWGERSIWKRGESDSSFLLCFVVIMSVIAALVLGHSLRSALTSEALLWDPSAQCFHWTRKTPFSKRSDTLGIGAMSGVWVELSLITDDDFSSFRPYYMADVSIRRDTGEEWLRVAYYCGQEPAMRLAEELSKLTGRPSSVSYRGVDPQ